MITQGMQTAIYLAAAVLFILSLSGFSNQETAKRSNWYGIIGMGLAILATTLGPNIENYTLLIAAFAIAAVIGVWVAIRVEMTQMPQLVAILHSFVGLAAVLVGLGSFVEDHSQMSPVELNIHLVEIVAGIFIGAITFTGSVIAYGKLQGSITGKAVVYPGRHIINILIVLACIVLGGMVVNQAGHGGMNELLIITALSSVLGILLVMAIGGADMPVVVSMLNSYSGWAAAAAGFMLGNDLLIVTGALVGSSGAILSYIMCKAMNRHFLSVILGGFGETTGKSSGGAKIEGEAVATSAEEVSDLLKNSKQVVIAPGYGMAVAKAQHSVAEMTRHLRDNGVNVRFAIHPVAGRLPGHMNVLLAEANVPYDIVLEMDEINPDMDDTDVVLVVGANDIVNPAAEDDTSSPIYGMPVIEAWKAKNVIVLKRSMASGYAGVQNPLFFKENTKMLFGDAKSSIEDLKVHMN